MTIAPSPQLYLERLIKKKKKKRTELNLEDHQALKKCKNAMSRPIYP